MTFDEQDRPHGTKKLAPVEPEVDGDFGKGVQLFRCELNEMRDSPRLPHVDVCHPCPEVQEERRVTGNECLGATTSDGVGQPPSCLGLKPRVKVLFGFINDVNSAPQTSEPFDDP